MQIVTIILLALLLAIVTINLIYIFKLESIWGSMWGQEVEAATWKRKRWAFILMITAQILGFVALWDPAPLMPVIYLLLMDIALLLFADSYRHSLNNSIAIQKIVGKVMAPKKSEVKIMLDERDKQNDGTEEHPKPKPSSPSDPTQPPPSQDPGDIDRPTK